MSGTATMPFVPPRAEVSLEELEARYFDITALYDLAGELVDTVESPLAASSELQWGIVEPLVNELGDATDILSEEFIHVAEGVRHGVASKASKARIEASLRRIYAALNDYRERVSSVTKKAYDAIENIADPVVAKIHRHIERVILVFMDFVQLSLASIMNHTELSQLKAREARVALMMHQMAQQQS